MAKRKRLTPARTDVFSATLSVDRLDDAGPVSSGPLPRAEAGSDVRPEVRSDSRAPIAQVAGEAAVSAAFEEVQAELRNARQEGRMVLQLPLNAIRDDYLIRDRLACDPEELAALRESIRLRGQQTPIEVTDLGQGRYGLISGWRRLRALRELYEDTGGMARFGQVQALLRLPQDRPAAYVAMVEENEVRADLSFYERARIVVQAVEAGVFDSDKQALQSLFSSASFSKRSKVKSFMPLVRGLDSALRHPSLIPERLGLPLSKALAEDPGFAPRLKSLLAANTDADPEAERAVLEAALKPASPAPVAPPKAASKPKLSKPEDITPGLRLRRGAGRVELEGEMLTEAMIERLKDWLKSQE